VAQTVGYVVQLNGTLSVQRADGSTRILAQKSEVLLSDTLTTQKDSFATINFTDGSSATLRPNTSMKLEQYQFDKDKPQADNLGMRLLKGGLRSVTGLIGKRGNQDAYKIKPAIRHWVFAALPATRSIACRVATALPARAVGWRAVCTMPRIPAYTS
jgi:hypothetical protein